MMETVLVAPAGRNGSKKMLANLADKLGYCSENDNRLILLV
jgi:hypothetical protein